MGGIAGLRDSFSLFLSLRTVYHGCVATQMPCFTGRYGFFEDSVCGKSVGVFVFLTLIVLDIVVWLCCCSEKVR